MLMFKCNVLVLVLVYVVLCIDAQQQQRARRSKSKRQSPSSSFAEFGLRNNNFYTLSAFHRTHSFAAQNNANQAGQTFTQATNFVPIDTMHNNRIIIPIGVSHIRPIQYVSMDHFNQLSRTPTSNDDVSAWVTRARDNSLKWTNPKNNNKTLKNVFNEQTSNNRTIVLGDAASVRDEKTSESNIHPVDSANRRIKSKVDQKPANHFLQAQVAHSPRFEPRTIELESSYVPLTIMFPSRATKLNVMPMNKAPDLVGQDSNQHKSINTRQVMVAPARENNNLSKGRRINLDHRTIFGDSKTEEPLVLSDQRKSNVPNNMQSIIRCVFPDFKFDGMEKVKSAC